jgi:hypothetical protein
VRLPSEQLPLVRTIIAGTAVTILIGRAIEVMGGKKGPCQI